METSEPTIPGSSRQGSKLHDPASADDRSKLAEGAPGSAPDPLGPPAANRHRLQDERSAITHHFAFGGHEGYLTVGFYRGHDYDGAAIIHIDKRRRGRTSRALWRWMKRRAAVEPSIGHLKSEHRLERNRLKGVAGDAMNAILAAAAMNFHKLLGACGHIFLRYLIWLWEKTLVRQPTGLSQISAWA
jgi:hypothetical protein